MVNGFLSRPILLLLSFFRDLDFSLCDLTRTGGMSKPAVSDEQILQQQEAIRDEVNAAHSKLI